MFWLFVFFFKQKTAYEMRISDWSSDVCSSDLDRAAVRAAATPEPSPAPIRMAANEAAAPIVTRPTAPSAVPSPSTRPAATPTRTEADSAASATPSVIGGEDSILARIIAGIHVRSEEHTSELQSLMRISYAVFCL